MPHWVCGGRMRAVPLEASMELHVWGTHAGGPTGGLGGAPYGTAKPLGGWKCQIGHGGRTRAVILGTSVELPMGPRSAVLGG
eukprot:5429624-Pyramimonas_sp.AAC.1